jgi:hypothetical protein
VSARYQRAESALWRRSSDAVVVLPLGTRDVFTLRGSGSVLWEILARARTLDEAAHSLGQTFGRPADAIAAEIEPVLQELVRRRAVVAS